jgi:hypothetical protein
MADQASQSSLQPPVQSGTDDTRPDGPVLLIILVPGGVSLEEPVSALIDIGLSATSIDTRGLADLIKREIPIFSGVAERLPDAPTGRLLVSLTTRAVARRAVAALTPLARPPHPVRAAIIAAESALGTA